MKVKLVWIEKDFRGDHLAKREEILQSESAKNPSRGPVAKLIARYHPELRSAGGVMLLDSSEEPYRWYVRAERLGPNRWVYVYAEPLADSTHLEKMA